MKQKRIILILSCSVIISILMTLTSDALGSEVDTHAQISFQKPAYIPVDQQPTTNKQGITQSEGILLNAPVANGEYDRQFGYVPTRKEEITVIPRLPSVGVTYIQSVSYIVFSAVSIIIVISAKKRIEKRKEL